MASANVVMLGPPGSGKGTQAKFLAGSLVKRHVSVGGILRTEIAANSPLGVRVARSVAAGELVADDDIVEVVRRALRTAERNGGWVLDGAPRTVTQAAALSDVIETANPLTTVVLALQAPAEQLRARLLRRAKTEGRGDDIAAVIDHRLTNWTTQGSRVIDWYQDRGLLVRVDATGDVEAVAARVAHLFPKLIPNAQRDTGSAGA